MVALSARRRAKFGDFVADFDSFELHKHGIRLKLQDQPFQILKLLLQRPGQLVTREELRMELWKESTFVDFDAGLNAAIRRLRDALNESAEEPRYIETLPRHGYRFIALVEIEASPPAVMGDELQTLSHDALGLDTASAPIEPSVHQEKYAELQRMRLPGSLVAACLLVAAVGMAAVALRSKVFAKHSAGTRINSIAVLPLQNLSGDPSQDYFADGMTDALITDLAQIKALRVISRTSTMLYKGTQKKVPQIAKELGVDAVLEGVAVRSGDRVRIDAQLIRGDNDAHLWAKSYERNLNDILSLQTDLARAIATEIAVNLTSEEQANLRKSPQTVNPQAYEAYLKGLYFRSREDADLEKAIMYFEKSVELDPSYAPANLELGDSYGMLAYLEVGKMPPAEAWLKSEKYLARTLELDPDSSLAHTLLGMNKLIHHCDRAGAEKELNLALTLDPNDMASLDYHSYYLLLIGQPEQAIAEKRRVLENDPLSLGTRSELGMYLAKTGHTDEAIQQYQYTLELDLNSAATYMRLGMLYYHKGQYEEAVVHLKKALALEKRPGWLGNLGVVYAQGGETTESLEVITELKETSKQQHVSPSQIARVYAALGDKDQAIAWLNKTHKGDLPPPSDKEFDGLRSDPRFGAIEARLNPDAGCTY